MDDYDRLIQICDSLATDYGFVILEKRFVDVARRYGMLGGTIEGWNKKFEIKEFDNELATRLIEDGVKPENILLLTFTKKAAAQMLSRATMGLDDRCEKVAGGTFHSFANIILRKYSKSLGLKNNFTIFL